jgi:arylsulfatase A-like enzyme
MEWDFCEPGETFRDGARRVWRGTLACVSQIDDVFGMLLQYLEERDLEKDTIVIYGGDHGGYHTVHGLPEKAPGICSDAVCRVPMIWRVPGLTPEGAVCDALVENTDISPTLLSLCGLSPMETADGLDITDLLAGHDASVHAVAVTENPWSKALRWGPWRMVHYQPETFPGSDVGELYNMAEDPQETDNLYAQPAYRHIVVEGRRLLLEWLIRTTRIVTNHPAARTRLTGTGIEGTYAYPLAGDGRAPTSLQPARREDVVKYYI